MAAAEHGARYPCPRNRSCPNPMPAPLSNGSWQGPNSGRGTCHEQRSDGYEAFGNESVKCSLEFRRKVDESKTQDDIEIRHRRDAALAPGRRWFGCAAGGASASVEQGCVRYP